MKMTKKEALTVALSVLTADEYAEARDVLTGMIEQLSKPRTTSEETKAKRKEATAAARAKLMEIVLPVLRAGLPEDGCTVKELYTLCANKLPEDFTANKVLYILLNEMRDEVDKIETKNKPNVYKPKKKEED